MLITPPNASNAPKIDKVKDLGDRLKALETEADLEKKYRALDTLAYEISAEKDYAISSVKNMNRGLKGFLYGALAAFATGAAISTGNPALGETIMNITALTGLGGVGVRSLTDDAIVSYAAQQKAKATALETLGTEVQKQMSAIPDSLPVVAEIKYRSLLKKESALAVQANVHAIGTKARKTGLIAGQVGSVLGALGLGIYGVSVVMTGGVAAGILPAIACIAGMTGLGHLANNFLPEKIKNLVQKRGKKAAEIAAQQTQVKEELDSIAKAHPQMAQAAASEDCAKIQKRLTAAKGEKDIGKRYFAVRKLQKEMDNEKHSVEAKSILLDGLVKVTRAIAIGTVAVGAVAFATATAPISIPAIIGGAATFLASVGAHVLSAKSAFSFSTRQPREEKALIDMSLDAIGEVVAIKKRGTAEEFLSSHEFTDLLNTHDGFEIQLKLRDDFRNVSERANDAEKALADSLAAQKAAAEAATKTATAEKKPATGADSGTPASIH